MDFNQYIPDNLIMGDIEGNLKLMQFQQQNKKGFESVYLNSLITSDNTTNFKRINHLSWVTRSSILCLGNDNSISIIEPSTLQASFRINTNFSTPFVADHQESKRDVIIVGFEDGYIKMFDLRKNQKKADRFFKSHSQGIACLETNPFDDDLFASGGLDGIVKVWDFRSDLPLYSISTTVNSKTLALKWKSRSALFSGGDDTSVTLHTLSDN